MLEKSRGLIYKENNRLSLNFQDARETGPLSAMRCAMKQTTRRAFLNFSVTGAVALSASGNALLRAGSTPPPRAWVTAKDRRYQQIGVSPWQASAKNPTKTIGLDPNKRFQNILGLGAAFTDASCYLFN